ncbi:hypothetical protein GDO78_013282 [Eleutherodactylus coqui]|uniref:Uncharacterized protein n=1 Tax=Eleutherodactylus coqui TaxID=57060 RepID=A0A8J6EZC5_ELECQ|nr:hypothetical protein GDO78_013282 [Eleutherodactylus coqui]
MRICFPGLSDLRHPRSCHGKAGDLQKTNKSTAQVRGGVPVQMLGGGEDRRPARLAEDPYLQVMSSCRRQGGILRRGSRSWI